MGNFHMERVIGGIIATIIGIYLGYLLIVYILAPLMGVALISLIVVMLFFAAIAALNGFYVSARNLFYMLQEANQAARHRLPGSRRNLLMQRYQEQPAVPLYFYDAGWFAIRYLTRFIWEPTHESARIWFNKAETWWKTAAIRKDDLAQHWLRAGAIGGYMGGTVYYLATVVFVAIFVVVQFIFLLLGVLFTAAAIILLTMLNFAYSSYYRIFHRCPDCSHQMRIPVFICPDCNERHTRLWPSAYGVLRHTCICGQKMPTLGILGRKHLVRRCENCNSALSGAGTNLHIPIVGGPSAGKSHYITLATMGLIEEYAPQHGLTVTFPNTIHKRAYDANVQRINDRQPLNKTLIAEDVAAAYNLQIKHPHHREPSLIYLYDMAGEDIGTDARAQEQIFFKYLSGLIFVIDPFSIPQIRQRYEAQLRDEPMVAPSAENPDRVYEHMMTVLEKRYRMKPGHIFKQPLAVVVTKVDAFDLEEHIGWQAALDYSELQPERMTPQAALSEVVKNYLEENGAGNLVRNLTRQFSNARYFSTAAYTRMDVEDARVLQPITWLLSETNSKPLQSSWIQRLRWPILVGIIVLFVLGLLDRVLLVSEEPGSAAPMPTVDLTPEVTATTTTPFPAEVTASSFPTATPSPAITPEATCAVDDPACR